MHQCIALRHHYLPVKIKSTSSETLATVIHPSNIAHKGTTGSKENVLVTLLILSVCVVSVLRPFNLVTGSWNRLHEEFLSKKIRLSLLKGFCYLYFICCILVVSVSTSLRFHSLPTI